MLAIMLSLLVSDPIRLQGDWFMAEQIIPDGTVLGYRQGQPQPIEHYTIHIKGDKATLRYDWMDRNDEVKMTFALNPARGEIDFTVAGCTFPQLKKGDKRASLYKFDGGAIVLCDADFMQKRPKEFKVGGKNRIYKFVRMKSGR